MTNKTKSWTGSVGKMTLSSSPVAKVVGNLECLVAEISALFLLVDRPTGPPLR